MRANKDVFESMRKNPKVKYDGERFSYKVTFMEAYMCTVSTPLCVHFYAPSLVCDFGIAFGLQSKHDVRDKNQLLFLVRKFPEGIAVVDLKDSYPNVMEDLQVNYFFQLIVLHENENFLAFIFR